MKTKHIALLGAGIIALLAGCVSKPIALLPVGPDTTSRAMLGAKGYLQVFSATEKSNAVASDDYTYFNLHSGYDINDASRKSVKFLPNHASNMDEWPDQVTLPAGNYNIVAESACSKYSYKSIGFSSRRRSGGLEQFDLEVIGVNVRLL